MNSEKYNNWQQSLREYSGTPGDFSKDAAWLRLKQRVRPQKRKRMIVLLAAACTVGCLVFLGVSLIRPKTIVPVTEKEGASQKEESPTVSVAPVKENSATGINLSTKPALVPVTNSSPNQQGSIKPAAVQPGNQPEIKIQPLFAEELPVADTLAATPVTARNETIKQVAKPAMRIVHINELNNNAQTTPPLLATEQPQQLRFPLVRSVFAPNNAGPGTGTEAAPEVKQRRGLLRSMASIKEY